MTASQNHCLSRRRFIALGVASLGIIAFGTRVAYINATAQPVTEQVRHGIGEWVELNGAFCSTSDENTKGYAIRLNKAQIVSYNEFIEYADDGSQAIEGLDVPSIVDLDVTLRNNRSEDDEKGSLFVFGMYLVPARLNDYLIRDESLLSMTQKAMRDSGNPGLTLSIRPGTTYNLHLPYTINDFSTTSLHGTDVGYRFTQPLMDTRYEWHLSRLPVQHLIDVCIG